MPQIFESGSKLLNFIEVEEKIHFMKNKRKKKESKEDTGNKL